MTGLVFTVEDAPAAPLDAAAHFHATIVPLIRADLAKASEIVILFEPADRSHRGWRLAAVQELAREAAPARVNAIAGSDPEAIAQARAFLAGADGVTGQVLAV